MPQEESSFKEFIRPAQEPFVPAQAASEKEELLPEDLKNRHTRRLEAKLQAEREANIEMRARLEAISEAQKFREATGDGDVDQELARIYGTDSPEKVEATRIMQSAFKRYSDRARQEALEEMRQELHKQSAEDDRERDTVQSYIEQVEDQYGIDLTSTAEARERQEKFRDLWFRLSPKDKDGEVTEYADPFEVYEIFQSRQAPNPAKQFASRSMQPSHSVQTTVAEDATVKYLRDQGILEQF